MLSEYSEPCLGSKLNLAHLYIVPTFGVDPTSLLEH